MRRYVDGMGYECIEVHPADDVTTITMNMPGRRNALSLAHLTELLRAFEEAGKSSAKGVILAANGPVFSAGHDLSEVAGLDLAGTRELLLMCTRLTEVMQSVPQVVIARVHALATAAGCQLVASADLAVAADTAAFATPGGQGGWFCHTPLVAVARAIGPRRALELGILGERIDAATALDWGLVHRVVPAAELDVATGELMAKATRGSALSKGLGKQAFYTQVGMPQPQAYAYAVEVMASSSQLPDAKEGMNAFVEKRPPRW